MCNIFGFTTVCNILLRCCLGHHGTGSAGPSSNTLWQGSIHPWCLSTRWQHRSPAQGQHAHLALSAQHWRGCSGLQVSLQRVTYNAFVGQLQLLICMVCPGHGMMAPRCSMLSSNCPWHHLCEQRHSDFLTIDAMSAPPVHLQRLEVSPISIKPAYCKPSQRLQ